MTNHTKFLYLARHAEAGWADIGQTDFDRPLTGQGHQAARWMAHRLAQRTPQPALIVSSPATRANATTAILAKENGYSLAEIISDPRLYEAEVDDLLAVIGEVEPTVPCLMLIGHNPSCTHLVNILARDPIADLPPGGLVALKFHLESWHNIDRAKAEILAIDCPSDRS